MELRFLNSQKIDFNKWDACIERYGNGLPYAQSWVLNCLHDNWGGVVLNDYEGILPLPFTKKLGMNFGIQSPWIQQLGIIASADLPLNAITKMWEVANQHLSLIHYKCNAQNPNQLKGFTINKWQNLVLPLNKSYNDLIANFNNNTKRNLKKTAQLGLKICNSDDANLLVSTYSNYQLQKIDGLKSRHLTPMHQLIETAIKNKKGVIKAAFTERGEYLGACFYLNSSERIIHLLPALTNEGRNCGAMFSIINAVINEFCESEKTLDFEGSMVESIARFYKGFGAQNETYFEYYKENMNPLTQLAWRAYKGLKG